ncbi:MFS transporter [Actinotignum timonense]|uniref:MFS transporter n=1 Tax=Actinotignum timonense TaxID=1870995 RepID=UPI002A83A142|nr:MFS transporter [Actinotignum timonense]MDY5145354.1 MFS transporter [Actinotignum timonense]
MTASSPSPGSPGAKSGASAAASGKSSGTAAAREATLNIAVRKARRRLVPFMMLLYVLAFLDRSNIGYAQQEYMLDTGIGEATFALGAGIFFVLYAFLGAPANLMMRKIGAQKWIGSIAVAWGLVSACMAFADTPAKFLTIRLLLGVVEAGFFPGMIYLASIFFPAKPRAYVMGLFYLGAPLALALGSPLSGALLQMHGFLGFPGWFWMFLIEGLLAAVVGCLAFFYFDDGPRSAKFLTPEERIVPAEAVEGEDSGSGVKSTLKDAFTNARVWTLAMAYFAIQVAVYGVVFYIPTQVARLLGESVGFKVSLVVAIPWVVSLIGTWWFSKNATTPDRQRIWSAGLLLAAGLALGLSAHATPILAIAALCIVATGVIACQPLFWTMPTNLLAGAALAAGIGFINTWGAVGGFVAPNLRVWFNEIFDTHQSSVAGLWAVAAVAILGSFIIVALKNRKDVGIESDVA